MILKENNSEIKLEEATMKNFNEAKELLDEINTIISSYDPVLKEKARDILLAKAFGDAIARSLSSQKQYSSQKELNEIGDSVEFASLIEKWTPEIQSEWVLLSAYYITKGRSEIVVASQEINAVLKQHGHPINSITHVIDANIDAQPALMMQVKKSGSTKQARKQYKITTPGIQFVETKLRSNTT